VALQLSLHKIDFHGLLPWLVHLKYLIVRGGLSPPRISNQMAVAEKTGPSSIRRGRTPAWGEGKSQEYR
jgi:hypothetical protein